MSNTIVINETPRYSLSVTGSDELQLSVAGGNDLQISLNGPAGPVGPTGPTGLNSITTATASNLTGFIAANGTNVSGATAGATAATPSTVVLRDATGGANFADVGASSVTSTGAITTTGANSTITTSGMFAGIQLSGFAANIATTGTVGFISTDGSGASIYTGGDSANIFTAGANAYIRTNGVNAYIQSRSTFKLYDGTYTTTLSHSPTANRAIAFPNKAGTVAMVDAETHTGAHVFSSTTRPTSSGTGTPAANSLITRDDGDARFGQQIVSLLTADDVTVNNSTTLVDSGLELSLPVGTWMVEGLTQFRNTTTSAGGKVGLALISGAVTSLRGIFSQPANVNALLRTSVLGIIRTLSTTAAIATDGVHYLKGALIVTSDAVIRIQFAQGVATATDSTVNSGSYLIATKIA